METWDRTQPHTTVPPPASTRMAESVPYMLRGTAPFCQEEGMWQCLRRYSCAIHMEWQHHSFYWVTRVTAQHLPMHGAAQTHSAAPMKRIHPDGWQPHCCTGRDPEGRAALTVVHRKQNSGPQSLVSQTLPHRCFQQRGFFCWRGKASPFYV